QRLRESKCRRSKEIFIVHRIVKRKTGVGTRRGQNLKESSVAVIVGVGVATTIRVAGTKPGIQEVNDWLPTGFTHKCASPLSEVAPTAVLQGSPEEHVELSVTLRLEDMNVVGT